MFLKKLWWLPLVMAAVVAMGLALGCGDDDDDDDDDNDDNDAADDDTGGDAVQEMMDQAYDACMAFWEACEVTNADEICTAWVEAYRPAMEEYADVMDTECMTGVMQGFFECVGTDCSLDGAWVTCNEQVQQEMLACFE